MKHLLFVLSVCCLFSCTPNNVKVDNSLEKFFNDNKVAGTFALMDNASGKFTVYNLDRYRDSAYLPASTFKIVNSLIGLQTGIISSDTMVIKWDGIQRSVPEWNKDLTMYEAFRVSAVPYYQEVARRIGKDTMQFWLDSLAYGNKKIGGAIDTFWLNNSLKITPDEQIGLVKRLYFNQLPFHQINQEIVKRAMLFENQPAYRLAYKTGLGFTEKGNQLGWVVGWIEENKHPYFFVLNIETPDKNADLIPIRINMLKGILKQLGFMEGRR
ncbi:class D beta-lactamase [Chitinophagaceae bacterium LB-8]|uniref:Beta-lactamase n=1 Tax=Paraflavisolibacter caeni TaxID=2982496 RepID=A0A9X2XZ05_9BACT|nr:class D beta-lactamase [Paraflavisolibacter caeni]MCU7551267.1 class D beta-lactamase [Paraflavisolibacter caeni]